MNTQKNLMWIVPIATLLFGLWAVFSSASYFEVYGTPAEAITPLAQSSMVILGAGLLFLSYVLFSIRNNTAESTVEWDMKFFPWAGCCTDSEACSLSFAFPI